jgi:hypothetical protein
VVRLRFFEPQLLSHSRSDISMEVWYSSQIGASNSGKRPRRKVNKLRKASIRSRRRRRRLLSFTHTHTHTQTLLSTHFSPHKLLFEHYKSYRRTLHRHTLKRVNTNAHSKHTNINTLSNTQTQTYIRTRTDTQRHKSSSLKCLPNSALSEN